MHKAAPPLPNEKMHEKEDDILKAIKLPDSKVRGFEMLVKQYQKPLYAHLRRMTGNHADADDALQNTFLKTWKHLDNFRGDAALYSWLYRIATNEALRLLQKRKVSQMHLTAESAGLMAASDGPDSELISQKLEAALATLPPKQRQVFDLKYFEEMKYEEIAHITGTSIGALKASYFHAVKKLEAHLSA
jgi:RNA polymerase sigma-70 factor (ECF subfamily)